MEPITHYLAGEGIVSYQYVPVKTNHLLHWIICALTFGLWFPGYVIIALHNHNRTTLKALPQSASYQPPVQQSDFVPGYWPPYGAVQVGPPPHVPQKGAIDGPR
jgi:hypothetical protein